ncbi:excisionase [Bacillus toyonensis]|uniref:excisionase family DNA-binding protein n=1 Tax=Bacillus toyonensis TaxID=155322 RepID=UPI000BEB666A|nr:helix-turn-helix domain-containing protein [Bacillus toyonensis]MCG3795990.1 excisionase family DNA-binding protein [Bacillus toyonensis]PED97819.1 excisionase [Bacillus toyonensis]
MERSTLTAKEVATYLGISLDLVYKESIYGSLPCIRIGRRKLFRKESLDRWMAKKELQCLDGQATNL